MGYKSPNYYTLPILSIAMSLSDSTTYYYGFAATGGAGTTTLNRVYVPRSGIIRKGSILTNSPTTVGTNENMVMKIRVNDATDYTFATVGLATQDRLFQNLTLDIPVAAGDFISIKLETPAWVTNPDGFRIGGTLFIECE